MKTTSITSGAVVISFSLLLSGCAASMHARNVEKEPSVLVDPSVLTKGGDNQMLYRYTNPKVDVRKYNKIMIDPVLVEKPGKLGSKERENYQRLADSARYYLISELAKDYPIVKTPEPDTMRIQMGIIDADSSKPIRNLTSRIVPIGMGISLAKYAITGKESGVGEITIEFKATDAMTGELLAAGLDRRVGGLDVTGIYNIWHHADAALKYWAQQGRYALCMRRGTTLCVYPDSSVRFRRLPVFGTESEDGFGECLASWGGGDISILSKL